MRTGGLITAGSLIAFYLSQLILDRRLPSGPWFFFFSLPGLLFLWLSFVHRQHK